MTVFIPGETISFQYQLPFLKTDITKIIVTYKQNGHIVLVRTVYPRQVENDEQGSHFAITLSQEESLLFEDNKYFYAQLNIMFTAPDGETRAACIELKGENALQHFREVVT